MNLHEYQGKLILKKFEVNVPTGNIAFSPDEAVYIANEIAKKTCSNVWAVKAQIHAGGRGKGGGVKIAKSIEEVRSFSSKILGMNLITPQTGPKGKKVEKVLIEQGIYYPGNSPIKELYVSILLNRNSSKHMILYSQKGGMDIEQVARENPDQLFSEEIDPLIGFQEFQARKIAFNLGLEGKPYKGMMIFITNLYKAYLSCDASLMEINPVLKTSDDLIYAADAKVSIDDNALFRHPEYQKMRDLSEEAPAEVEASKYSLSFVKLNGNVGCMVNGAGLAMATMDIIKQSGGNPANFLDIGGSATVTKVEAGFRIILSDSDVKAILINIFGGIVHCDMVAHGIVDAYRSVGHLNIPVIARLQGTNAEEGKKIIDESGLKVYSANTLQEASDLVHTFVMK
jgi:succinyl-CoA synthetase beta subunit